MTTFACCVMVKDEEKQIIKTLSSMMNHVDEYIILDTGSTDSTISLIEQWAAQVQTKLTVYNTVFLDENGDYDFSRSRNVMLDYAFENHKNVDYLYLLDANDEFRSKLSKENISNTLTQEQYKNFKMFHNVLVWKDGDRLVRHESFRFMKNVKHWRYEYPVHEMLMHQNRNSISEEEMGKEVSKIDESVFYYFQDRNVEVAEKLNRSIKDIKILSKVYNSDKKDTRVVYYLGNSYFFSKMYKEAIPFYEERVNMETYSSDKISEEVVSSCMNIANSNVYHIFIEEEKEKKRLEIIKSVKNKLELNEELNEEEKNVQQTPFITESEKIVRWQNAVSWFWRAYYYCPLNIEPLLAITEKMYMDERISEAYFLSKMCLQSEKNTKLSINRNVEIYDYHRFELDCKICLKNNKWREALQSADAAHRYILLTENQTLRENRLETIKELLRLAKLNNDHYSPFTKSDKKIVAMFGGKYYYKWDEKWESLGGSETKFITLAKQFARKNYEVHAFIDISKEFQEDGVKFKPLSDYINFVSNHEIEVLTVSRFSSNLTYGPNINKVFFLCEDLQPAEMLRIDVPDLTKVICVSEWHAKYLKSLTPEHFHQKIDFIYNTVEPDLFEKTEKVPKSFIYSSCPTRGLIEALYQFNLIRMMCDGFENASFNIYCDFETDYVKKNCNVEEIKKIANKIPNVHLHGRVSKKELYQAMSKSKYWLYPTNFQETFCITAVECQLAGVIPIQSGVAALSETVEIKPVKDFDQTRKLIDLLESNESLYQKKVNDSIKKGKSFSMEEVFKKWELLLN